MWKNILFPSLSVLFPTFYLLLLIKVTSFLFYIELSGYIDSCHSISLISLFYLFFSQRSGFSSSLPFSSSSISKLMAMKEGLSLSCHSLSASCFLLFSPDLPYSIIDFSHFHTTLSLSFVFFSVVAFKRCFSRSLPSATSPPPPPPVQSHVN